MSQWGALESVITSITGFVTSASFMWWRQSRLEKQQDQQAKEDRDLSNKVHTLELEIKQSGLSANTKAMNSMSSALTLIAESNAKIAETVVNQQKLLDKMERSIDTAFGQIRTIEKEYVSKDHFDTFKENCKRAHKGD